MHSSMQSLQLYSFRHFICYTEQIILQRRSNPHGSIFADSQNSSQSTSPFLAGKKNKANHAGAFTVHILHACKCHQMKSISGRNGFQHSVRGIYGPPLVYNCCCRNPILLGFSVLCLWDTTTAASASALSPRASLSFPQNAQVHHRHCDVGHGATDYFLGESANCTQAAITCGQE